MLGQRKEGGVDTNIDYNDCHDGNNVRVTSHREHTSSMNTHNGNRSHNDLDDECQQQNTYRRSNSPLSRIQRCIENMTPINDYDFDIITYHNHLFRRHKNFLKVIQAPFSSCMVKFRNIVPTFEGLSPHQQMFYFPMDVPFVLLPSF